MCSGLYVLNGAIAVLAWRLARAEGARGTPLITADTPGARELLTDGESALLVPPGDPAALAEAMRRVAGDPELARRLSIGGRKIYEERASEEVLGARWRSLIQELL